MHKMNLEVRLAIILLIFFFLSGIGALVRASFVADNTVAAEISSASSLVDRLFSIAGLEEDSPFNAKDEPAFLQELIALENIRHIDVRVQSENVDYPQLNEAGRDRIQAPGWFISLVYPQDETVIRTFIQSNGDIVNIYADPGDEIEEIWFDTWTRFLANFCFLVVMSITITAFTRRWMKPLDAIVEVLDNVEQGDFSRRVPTLDLPEIHRVGDRVNHLTTWLGASKSENERLTRKSVVVQEQERRFLAQELHDSLGQAVSAIKAIAVTIEDRTRDKDPNSASCASNIEDIADSAYNSVRKLMTDLRPSVLDEFGLMEGLKQMVDDWNVHHEDTFCRLRIEGDYGNLHDEQQINIYRIVQEALTNVSKYAKAENVSITLSGNEIITLSIIDDGVGFHLNEITQSMGLTGIRDRVTLLRGELDIASKPGKGVSIQIEFPRINTYRRRSSDR